MEISPSIQVQDLILSDHMRGLIDEQIVKLEKRFGRITRCDVTLRAPGNHHRMGGCYAVHIRLNLPGGRRVVVGPPPAQNPQLADIGFAIHDAFRRARRQLELEVQKLKQAAGTRAAAARRKPRKKNGAANG